MRLYLLRHAHAKPGGGGVVDAERPLSERGRREAAGVGSFLAARSRPPDQVLCSSARRAVETMQLAIAAFSERPEVFVLDDLYQASAWKLFERARGAEAGDASTLLLVAHNPGIAELAARLAARGDPAGLQSLSSRYLPATLAEIELPGDRMRDAEPAGTLVHLHVA